MRVSTVRVELSKLHPGRENPRRVKPTPEAGLQLIASVRAFGLVQPLVVRPLPEGEYQVIAGNRRLAALRHIHKRSTEDPKIRCEVRDVDDATAEALALSENFVRERMYPLDEAEAFAPLAADETQGVDAIGSAFGVTERYVRQRMKLAGLAKVVKAAFRENAIDICTAEVFASIPEDRQKIVWEETNGHPRYADHVRNIIDHGWIDAGHALFDLSTLPEFAVSRDLFSERVLVERAAFMAAQSEAMDVEKTALLETGWKEVVAGRYEDVHDQPLAMDPPEGEFDPETARKLEKLVDRRQKWEAKLEALKDDDDKALASIEAKLQSLDAEEQEIERDAPVFYSETTQSVGTAFLMLYPDGQVRREYRVPRQTRRHAANDNGDACDGNVAQPIAPPTSDDLNERQLADTFSHQVLAVREALLKAPALRKRLLVLILHDKVRGETLAVRHDANAVTLHAQAERFTSSVFHRLKEKRAGLDPFEQDYSVDDHAAFSKLIDLPDARINQLIDLLAVKCLTAHLQRRTELVHRLSADLKVDVRQSWRPDATWLAGFRKIQLCHLLAELYGPFYSPLHESRKKSELVDGRPWPRPVRRQRGGGSGAAGFQRAEPLRRLLNVLPAGDEDRHCIGFIGAAAVDVARRPVHATPMRGDGVPRLFKVSSARAVRAATTRAPWSTNCASQRRGRITFSVSAAASNSCQCRSGARGGACNSAGPRSTPAACKRWGGSRCTSSVAAARRRCRRASMSRCISAKATSVGRSPAVRVGPGIDGTIRECVPEMLIELFEPMAPLEQFLASDDRSAVGVIVVVLAVAEDADRDRRLQAGLAELNGKIERLLDAEIERRAAVGRVAQAAAIQRKLGVPVRVAGQQF